MPSSLTCLWVEGPFCLAVRITPNAGVQPLVDKAEVSYLKHSLIPDGVLVSFNDPPPILSPLVRQLRVWSICSGHSQHCSCSHHNKGHQRLLSGQWRDYREHNKLAHSQTGSPYVCMHAKQTCTHTHTCRFLPFVCKPLSTSMPFLIHTAFCISVLHIRIHCCA